MECDVLFVHSLKKFTLVVVYHVWFAGPKDIKDIFSTLKDCATEHSQSNMTLKHQVILYILTI